MKKLLSLTLAAAIGLGSMNVQAAKENPKDTADLIGKRKYILPALLVGAGVFEVAYGTFCLYAGFVELPRMQRDLEEKAFNLFDAEEKEKFSKLDTEEKSKFFTQKFPFAIDAHFLAKMSKGATQGLGIMLFSHGLINIKEGLDSLKRIKRIRARLKELSDKLKAKKLEKEQVQA